MSSSSHIPMMRLRPAIVYKSSYYRGWMFWLRLRAPAAHPAPSCTTTTTIHRRRCSNPIFLAKCGPFFILVLPQTQKETEVLRASEVYTSSTYDIIFFCISVCPLATQSDVHVSSESIKLLSSRHHHHHQVAHHPAAPRTRKLACCMSQWRSQRVWILRGGGRVCVVWRLQPTSSVV